MGQRPGINTRAAATGSCRRPRCCRISARYGARYASAAAPAPAASPCRETSVAAAPGWHRSVGIGREHNFVVCESQPRLLPCASPAHRAARASPALHPARSRALFLARSGLACAVLCPTLTRCPTLDSSRCRRRSHDSLTWLTRVTRVTRVRWQATVGDCARSHRRVEERTDGRRSLGSSVSHESRELRTRSSICFSLLGPRAASRRRGSSSRRRTHRRSESAGPRSASSFKHDRLPSSGKERRLRRCVARVVRLEAMIWVDLRLGTGTHAPHCSRPQARGSPRRYLRRWCRRVRRRSRHNH